MLRDRLSPFLPAPVIKQLLRLYAYFNIVQKKRRYNKTSVQRGHWESFLKEYDQKDDAEKDGSFGWGDPNSPNGALGNYLQVSKNLQEKISSGSTVLQIGTLGGKWMPYIEHANKIICVDINEFFVPYIKKTFPHLSEKLEFYISKGNELSGVEDSSVDFVFSIDSLLRVEKKYIFNYLQEIKRVLSVSGEAFIHLPHNTMRLSREGAFTNLSDTELVPTVDALFSEYSIDKETLKHGCILTVKK